MFCCCPFFHVCPAQATAWQLYEVSRYNQLFYLGTGGWIEAECVAMGVWCMAHGGINQQLQGSPGQHSPPPAPGQGDAARLNTAATTFAAAASSTSTSGSSSSSGSDSDTSDCPTPSSSPFYNMASIMGAPDSPAAVLAGMRLTMPEAEFAALMYSMVSEVPGVVGAVKQSIAAGVRAEVREMGLPDSVAEELVASLMEVPPAVPAAAMFDAVKAMLDTHNVAAKVRIALDRDAVSACSNDATATAARGLAR